MAKRAAYPSDVTDGQWPLMVPVLARNGVWGRPREVDLREVVNALFSLVRTGCQWRSLPHDFPHPSSVRYSFDKGRDDGTWQDLNDILREPVRVAENRSPEPTAAILDSQSVKTTEAGGERGFDAGSMGENKVKGRKRHLLVDTLGNLWLVMVHSAGWSDQEGGLWLLGKALQRFSTLLKVGADNAYRGDLITLIRDLFEVDLEVVKKDPNQEGFVVQVRRWVGERSLGWYSRHRRLSKDYEHRCEVSETMVYIASIQVMLKRLRPATSIEKPYLRRKLPRAA